MEKISTGIEGLDRAVDFLYIGDNVVWEVDAGCFYDLFIKKFIQSSLQAHQNVLYVSFNKSPQSLVDEFSNYPNLEKLYIIDCFTAGKGKNDVTFEKFYHNSSVINVNKISNPKNAQEIISAMVELENNVHSGIRYVFDSLTGMQDLWESEAETYKFFTYMCPRLFDLETIAYWILEKDAHSQKFKANIRHVTQVVFDLYKRKDSFYIKALKLSRRTDKTAFKPHVYEIENGDIVIKFHDKEPLFDIGNKLKEIRISKRVSQRDLADKVGLTPSFISQIESNQIIPSITSFIHICYALGVNPGDLLDGESYEQTKYIIRKSQITNSLIKKEERFSLHKIVENGRFKINLVLLSPDKTVSVQELAQSGSEFIYVLNGKLYFAFQGKKEEVITGDCIYLKKPTPALLENKGGESAELLLVTQ